MPPPKVSDFEFYTEPPRELKDERIEIERRMDMLHRYLRMIHHRMFTAREDPVTGELKGDLDEDNIASALPNTGFSHANATDVTVFDHHGSDAHDQLRQAGSVSSASSSSVAVSAADAGASYTAAEQALLNELKADLTTLVTDVNALAVKVNAIITSLRNADLMA